MRAVLSDPATLGWFEYQDLAQVLSANSVAEVVPVLTQAEFLSQANSWYAVGYVSYDAAPAFDSGLVVHTSQGGAGDVPLVQFALFRTRKRVCLATPEVPQVISTAWYLDLQRQTYADKIGALQQYIQAGEVYQVNYTGRCVAQVSSGWNLFEAIRTGATYAAFLDYPDIQVVSASPELFFCLNSNQLTCIPMKGTARRGIDPIGDAKNRNWLATSVKNRAENLMITDMVRNDMGRIAQVGSVKCNNLFQIEGYPTVWQMTSTVQCRTRASIVEIFTAMFPAASITGAPKQASMEIITQHENSPRQLYTGAIGVIGPGRQATFNVAIRTAWIEPTKGVATFGVGGGIVADSTATEEYDELLSKTQVLASKSNNFNLLETMRLNDGQIYLLQRHMDRASNSARHFGFAWSESDVLQNLDTLCRQHPKGMFRLRLLVDRLGGIEVEATPLQLPQGDQLIKLAPHCIASTNELLLHKTTHREVYDQFYTAEAKTQSHYEIMLYNQLGYITETTIANIVYRLDGTLYTPPLADGLLPGTLRAKLLADRIVTERSLSIKEMPNVSQWWLVNALRGWRQGHLVD